MMTGKPSPTNSSARLGLTIFLCGMLSACATWAEHGVAARASQPLRVAVLPVQNTSGITELSDIESGTTKSAAPAEAERVKERMAAVTAEITRALEMRLAAGPHHFEVIPEKRVQQALTTLSPPLGAASLTPAQAEQLGAALHTQALLHVDLVGYGKLKHSWLVLLIGSGMVEAVAQGWIVTRATGSSSAGLAVGLEEAVQELLTWGGGAYIIQRHFVPVILRGELISTTDGKNVWSDTVIKTLDRKALQTLPADKRNNRATQLQLTTQRAVDELTDDLRKKARSERGDDNGGAPSA